MARLGPSFPPSGLRGALGDWAALLGWAVLVVVVLVGVASLDAFTAYGPGPAFFPRALSLALGVLVAFQAVVLLRTGRAAAGEADPFVPEGESSEHDQPATPGAPLRFLLIVGSLFVYATLLETLGFALATAALACSVLVLLGRPLLRAIVEGIVATFAFRFAFGTLLGVQLPESTLIFLRGIGL